MSKLSVVIPTKNVATIIEACLQSVALADEVILIDTNSTDGTREIAQRFSNVKIIINEPAGGNFTINRKIGFEMAKGDWILKLDSDERLTGELQEELKEFLADSKKQKFNGYFFKVRLYMFGKFISHGVPLEEIRLFRKGFYQYGEDVHGQIAIIGPTGKFRHSYIHYNHRSIFQWIEKMNRYTEYDLNLALKNRKIQPFWKILVTPVFVFLKSYLWRRGFLCGLHGLLIALLLGYYAFIEKAKLWEANYKQKHLRK